MDLAATGFLVLAILSVVMFAHACYSIYLTVWAWNTGTRLKPERKEAPPSTTFSVLLPARHEEEVISETMRGIASVNYPSNLMEVFVICSSDDHGTIQAAQRAIRDQGLQNFVVITFDDGPINKPHGLNTALRYAGNDFIAVFDAEDDVHPELLRAVNAQIRSDDSDVVQGPVQLMNHDSSWYATLNVLEYFVWYSSRLRLQALIGALPLGGNTVFMRRSKVLAVGGWDDNCLTEDADIGLRLSAAGASMHVLFDPELATREETPHTLGGFIRQRSRWHQGFIQVLRKGAWRSLSSRHARWLGVYTMFFPIINSITALLWPVAIVLFLLTNAPVLVALLTYLPAYALVLHLALNIALLIEFTRLYRLPFRITSPLIMAITYLPYQWLIGISSIRSVLREMAGKNGWEKTFHPGAHRVARVEVPIDIEAA